MTLKKWIRCRAVIPAKTVSETYTDPNGGRFTYDRQIRPGRPCRKEAKYIENEGDSDARPVCEECCRLFARQRLTTDEDLERWGSI